jgi:hypothetical protein
MSAVSENKETAINGVFYADNEKICVNVRDQNTGECFEYNFACQSLSYNPKKAAYIHQDFIRITHEYAVSGGLECIITYSSSLPTPVGNLCKLIIKIEDLDKEEVSTLRMVNKTELSLDKTGHCFPYMCKHN